MMTAREELIQAIERSPDDLVWVLLELLRVWQQSHEIDSSHTPETGLERSKYDFSDLTGRLAWQGDAVSVQRMLRNEW